MNIRLPVRAGTFYEPSPASCRHHAEKLIAQAELPTGLPAVLLGGLVPHAGWAYSGKLAAMTIKALARNPQADTFVLFGADHYGTASQGEVFDSGVWRTPLGEVQVNTELATALLSDCPVLRSNPDAHAEEHSLEVQVPLLQVLCPAARIVPIAVPPLPLAVDIGKAVGRVLAERFPAARIIGSTDLTHHGGGHFPAPGGHGPQGEKWSRRNDRRMPDLVESLAADQVVQEARLHQNACGAGAIAASVAACKVMGATRGLVLQYTTSYEVIHAIYPGEPDDTTVGYASIVFA
jgi:AmmeMemoRadiSam system protein B